MNRNNINNQHTRPRKAKLTGIRFGLASPDEIKAISVAEITTGRLHRSRGPTTGALNDLRLGPVNAQNECKTCGCGIGKCPGHPGHHSLASPVINPQCFKLLPKILTCVCMNCARLLVKPKKNHHQKVGFARLRSLSDQASKVKNRICGDLCIAPEDWTREKEEENGGCGFVNSKIKKESLYMMMIATTAEAKLCLHELSGRVQVLTEKKLSTQALLSNEYVLDVLNRISKEDLELMGFRGWFSHPSSMIMTVLVVPSTEIRPKNSIHTDDSAHDPSTLALQRICKTNQKVLKHMQNPSAASKKAKKATKWKVTENRIPHVPRHSNELWNLINEMNFNVATHIQNELPGVRHALQRNGRPSPSLRKRIIGKEGRIRGSMQAKRVNFSARTVIGPNPGRDIDELGVPIRIAMIHYRRVQVTRFNIKELTKLIRKGAFQHPGARFVEREDGSQVDLKCVEGHRIKLQLGWVVSRYLQDGDIVLANRQPSLHRPSIMAHKVKVISGNMIRLGIPVTSPYGADFDGDEMNIHTLHEESAIAEAKELMMVRKQILSVRDGGVVIYPIQDCIFGCWVLSKPDTILDQFQYNELLMKLPKKTLLDQRRVPTGPTCTGRDILSLLFPPDLTLRKGDCVFKRGRLVDGLLTKGVLHHLVFVLAKDYSNDAAADFLRDSQRICDCFLMMYGASITLDDCRQTEEAQKKKKDIVSQVRSVIDEYPYILDTYREDGLCRLLGELREKTSMVAINALDQKRNNFLGLVMSGSKGSLVNLAQVLSMAGQIYVDCGRKIGQIPHLRHLKGVARRGMVFSSFSDGLTPMEYFFHSLGGREGLVDTSVRTSQTGYFTRKLVAAMTDLMVMEDGTVRNTDGHLYELRYGGDGIDPMYVEHHKLPYIHWDETKMREVYVDEECQEWEMQLIWEDWNYFRKRIEFEDFGFFDEDTAEHIAAPTFFHHHRIISKLNEFNIDDSKEHPPATVTEASRELHSFLCNPDIRKHWQHGANYRIGYTAHLLAYFSSKRMAKEYQWTVNTIRRAFDGLFRLYFRSRAESGTMVGLMAAQSLSEVLVQSTLNAHRMAGNLVKLKMGFPRCNDLLNFSKNPSNETLSMVFKLKKPEYANRIICNWPERKLRAIVESVNIITSEQKRSNPSLQLFKMQYPSFPVYGLHFVLKRKYCAESGIQISKVASVLQQDFELLWAETETCSIWVFPLRKELKWIRNRCHRRLGSSLSIDSRLLFHYLCSELLCKKITGISNIASAEVEKHGDDTWIRTSGSNLLAALQCPYIVPESVHTNNLKEVHEVFGIEAAKRLLANEYVAVLRFSGAYVSFRHIWLIAGRQTFVGVIQPLSRHGVLGNFDSVLSRCFETQADVLLGAGVFEEKEHLRGVPDNAMVGNFAPIGTRRCDLFTNVKQLQQQMKEIDLDGMVQKMNQKRRSVPVDIPSFRWRQYPFDELKTSETIIVEGEQSDQIHLQQVSSWMPTSPVREITHEKYCPTSPEWNFGFAFDD